MRIRYWSMFATAMLLAAGTAFAADNPWVGTWKMDPAQSKLTGHTIHFASGTTCKSPSRTQSAGVP